MSFVANKYPAGESFKCRGCRQRFPRGYVVYVKTPRLLYCEKCAVKHETKPTVEEDDIPFEIDVS